MTLTAASHREYPQATIKTTATNSTLEYASVIPTTPLQSDQKTQTQKKEESSKITTDVQNETQELTITTHQELEIKQQASTSETKESLLVRAIQESLQTPSIETTQAANKMTQMQEKYKDIYTPMPEKFSQEIEDLQTALIRERYPDYLTFEEFAEKYLVPLEDASAQAQAKAKLLQDIKMAESIKTEGPNKYNGGVAYVKDEEREAFIADIMREHPNNTQDKYFSNLTNSPQRARAYNAAVYEGLEAGENLLDASTKAGQVQNSYIDNTQKLDEQFSRSRKFFHEYYEEMEKSTQESKKIMQRDGIFQLQQEENSNKYDGTVLDLREYGFDREISTFTLSNSKNAMVAALQEQIKFFDFILKNQDFIKSKYDELDKKYKEANSFEETVINPIKDTLPIAQRALDVFIKYKIFDEECSEK